MKNKSVLQMSAKEAEQFFLKSSNYCNLELPEYFDFQRLLDDIYSKLVNKSLSSFNKAGIDCRMLENVNYLLVNNKDGRYSWRPYELIHPALYVELVKEITKKENWDIIIKRLKYLQCSKYIVCCSMPFESNSTDVKKEVILNWWERFEQQSISSALEYEYIACTDISNCYGSIYTHTISWAIHTKTTAKSHRRDYTMIGNIIDKYIRMMHYDQTNGIPQGSVLMDFIAEIVLAFADFELAKKLKKMDINEYKILRYRDDYKIFAHDSSTLDNILKVMTEILLDLNFKLNDQKTIISSDIILNSVKPDKIYSLENIPVVLDNVQKYLLIIRNMIVKYKNSGSAVTLLKNLYINKIIYLKNNIRNVEQLISILVDIMILNPKTYAVGSAIISKLLLSLNVVKRKRILELIRKKFEGIVNSDYLEIWLQRLTIVEDRSIVYKSKICEKIYKNNKIWNSTWTNLRINEKLVVDDNCINNLKLVVSPETMNNKEYY